MEALADTNYDLYWDTGNQIQLAMRRCCLKPKLCDIINNRDDLESMSRRSRLRLGTRNMVSMMLHSVCLIADDDGENKAIRSHVLSSNLSGTARRPPATTILDSWNFTHLQFLQNVTTKLWLTDIRLLFANHIGCSWPTCITYVLITSPRENTPTYYIESCGYNQNIEQPDIQGSICHKTSRMCLASLHAHSKHCSRLNPVLCKNPCYSNFR